MLGILIKDLQPKCEGEGRAAITFSGKRKKSSKKDRNKFAPLEEDGDGADIAFVMFVSLYVDDMIYMSSSSLMIDELL